MNLYREVLDNIPTAAIVVDKKMRVRYTNRSFRECFRSLRPKGTLKETTGCTSEDVCGEGVRCAYCPMRSLFRCHEERRPRVPQAHFGARRRAISPSVSA